MIRVEEKVTMSSIETQVSDIIRKVAKLDETPAVEADLMMEVGIDSLMALRILAAIEKTYNVQIPDAELQKLTTVRKIADFLHAQGSTAKAG